MNLREYQARAIDQLYSWFTKNSAGNPVLCMPGGSGKSVVIASIAKDALQNWPETRVLMLVHSKELIAQNAQKLKSIWPNAPLGVYSASLGRRDIGEPITYAGVGSVRSRASQIGHIDLCIVDECHAISNTESGSYRKLIADLMQINPAMRVVGFSASPYRLGQGMVTDGDEALFSDIIEPVTIEELVYKGFLCPLRSKITKHKLDSSGLHKRQGEYIAAEMQEKYNTECNNDAVAQEVMERAASRKHWLIFCSGIEHGESVAEKFRQYGIRSESLSSKDSKSERDRKIADFESGKIRALTNVGILTTGYDFPSLDCIVFLRSTMSPGLYLQMAVRGMRIADGKTDCLVLDFSGVISQHGPITAIEPPKKKGSGDAPVKVCPKCDEVLHLSCKVCPECGHEFVTEEDEKKWRLANDDIMGEEGSEMAVTSWKWSPHTSRTSGKEMVRVSYYGALSDPPVTEYLPILHEGYAGQRALATLASIANGSGCMLADNDLAALCNGLNQAQPPALLEYTKDGKFYRVIRREWYAEA